MTRSGSTYWSSGGSAESAYAELAAPDALDDYVECLWVQRIGGSESFTQPVLPDACVDVVALGDEVLLAGPATRATTLHYPPGALTVGIRFRPGAAPALMGVSAAEFRDVHTPLDQIWGRAGTAMGERLASVTDWRQRLDVITETLLGRLDHARRLDPVGVGIGPLLNGRPGRPVAEVADEVGLSERQLRRRVEDAVGYPPRTLARILRFQRFLSAARASRPGRHLAAVAAEVGYADQAHLTRDCRELSGMPPAALLDWEASRTAG